MIQFQETYVESCLPSIIPIRKYQENYIHSIKSFCNISNLLGSNFKNRA